ncbi:2-oxoglutarate (2OG) and Fe(II)-dependent oxygenase superfamily protein [Rhynchospora pubera]|uniref:2-oxoglutarate (2OG) and Fe(II)-dependent oxygenase superfamily protein n=1 Tax=Rhynchospora pubera TaxID=906938 RepID=A0AAV8FRQ5_9POAL|nr:2-oxoglutarate (2OG) and Fe(II)-dependent oxygenase superfamily protein [Rhynchospora pubera]
MAAVVPASPVPMASVPPPSVTSPSTVPISDERDLFISWLRAEFAAANAIIDLLLSHLRLTGGPGEYDHVAASLQQRRGHWVPLIHLQQYFPVTDVAIALQHSAWLRQQGTSQPPLVPPQHQSSQGMPRGGRRHGVNGMSYGHGNDHGSGYNNGSGFNNRRYFNNNRTDSGSTTRENVSVSCGGSSEEGSSVLSEANSGSKEREREASFESKSCVSTITDESHAASHRDGNSENGGKIPSYTKEKAIPKEFVCNESIDGNQMVNVLEGLKIYEELVERSDANRILSWVNETRDKGRRDELQGQTFIVAQRPNRGHGREIIQLGTPVIEGSLDEEHAAGISRERKVEAVPGAIQDILDQLVQLQVIPCKPDYCIIDFFSEGEYSHPHIWPNYYGRPVYNLCLTECDMVFGRHVTFDYKGNHKGPLKLSLSAGDLVVLRSKGADMVKRAIPTMRKERVVLTFGKFQPRRNYSITSSNAPSSSSHPSQWNPHTSSRSSNHHPRHNTNSKHYGYVTTLAEAAQPIFVPAPQAVAPAPIPVVLSVAAPLAQTAPHLLVPGTGVFLPPPPPPMNSLPENFQASGEIVNSKPNGTFSESETANGVITEEEIKHGKECNGNTEAGSGAK